MSSTEEPVKAEEVKVEETKVEETKVEETKAEETKTEETKTEETKPEENTTETAATEETGDKAAAKILKTSARINEDYRKNKKFDPRKLPESEDPLEMRAQVEFYFNNANLPSDEHMWTLTGGSENKPVELKHIHNFGRMRRFPNYAALVAALKESELLEVSGEEGSEVVKRKVAYKMRGDKGEVMRASVYVKGFGDEDAMTQFNLEKFFKQYGGVNAVRLRRTEENLFKGSVFVEFASEEDAKAFLAVEPAPKWEGHDLKIMSKQAYVDDKSAAIKAGEIKPSNSKDKKFFEGRGGKGDKNTRSGGRGGFRGDKNDWKSRRDHDQKGGFRDNRDGRGRGRGRGGRGRGGRGGHRDRDDRRDRNRDDKPADNRNGVQPTIKTTDTSGKPVDSNANGKRPREENGNGGEPQAKKVDVKAE